MNTTTTTENSNNNIEIYILMAEMSVNLLIALYTSYRLGYIELSITDFSCCGSRCSEFHFNAESDSESRTK